MSNAPNAKQRKPVKAAKPAAPKQSGPGGPDAQLRAKLREQRKLLKQQARPGPSTDSGYKRQLKAFLNATMDPYNHEPQRVALGGGRPTATNRLFRKSTAGVAATPVAGDAYASGVTFKAVFRHPVLAEIEYLPAGPATNLAYQWKFAGPNGLQNFPLNSFTPLNIATAVPIGSIAPHGPYQPVIVDAEGVSRIWIDVETTAVAASNSYIHITGAAALTNYTLDMSRMIDDTIYEWQVIVPSDAGGNINYQLPRGYSGYYTFKSQVAPLLPPNVGISHQSVCGCFAHRMLPGLENNWGDIDAMRVTAVSALFSDRTSTLVSQGNITSHQVGATEHWTVHAGLTAAVQSGTVDPYTTISSYNGSYSGPYKKGAYRFLKPASLEELNLKNLDMASTACPPAVDLDTIGDFIVIATDVGVNSGVIAEFTATWHVEFESESQWRDLRAPDVHPRVLEDAQFLLTQAPSGMENPLHLSDVWNFVRKAARVLGDVGGALTPFAGAYAPAVGAASAAARAVGNL